MPALRFEIFSPSRNRAILETTTRLMTGRDEASGLAGIRAFAGDERVHPWLIALAWKAYRAVGGTRPVSLLGDLVDSPAAADPIALAGIIAACLLEKDAAAKTDDQGTAGDAKSS